MKTEFGRTFVQAGVTEYTSNITPSLPSGWNGSIREWFHDVVLRDILFKAFPQPTKDLLFISNLLRYCSRLTPIPASLRRKLSSVYALMWNFYSTFGLLFGLTTTSESRIASTFQFEVLNAYIQHEKIISKWYSFRDYTFHEFALLTNRLYKIIVDNIQVYIRQVLFL